MSVESFGNHVKNYLGLLDANSGVQNDILREFGPQLYAIADSLREEQINEAQAYAQFRAINVEIRRRLNAVWASNQEMPNRYPIDQEVLTNSGAGRIENWVTATSGGRRVFVAVVRLPTGDSVRGAIGNLEARRREELTPEEEEQFLDEMAFGRFVENYSLVSIKENPGVYQDLLQRAFSHPDYAAAIQKAAQSLKKSFPACLDLEGRIDRHARQEALDQRSMASFLKNVREGLWKYRQGAQPDRYNEMAAHIAARSLDDAIERGSSRVFTDLRGPVSVDDHD